MGRTKHYKIGKSNDPQVRLAALQTASPHKLKLLHAFKVDNATAAEETLHIHFHQARMEGEWFKLQDTDINTLLQIDTFKQGRFVIGEKTYQVAALFNSKRAEHE